MNQNTHLSESSMKSDQVTHSPRRKSPPGPRENWLLGGSARQIQRDPLGFNISMLQRYGNVVAVRFLIWPTYMIFHPQDVKHVLQENHRNYNKDTYLIHFLRPLLGKGLFSNNGQSWLHQRRLMQPAFHRKQLATFGTMMTDVTGSMLERWQHAASDNQPLDVAQEMMQLTLRVAGQALFSLDLSDETDTVGQAFTALMTPFMDYIYNPLPPLGFPTPRNRRIQHYIRTLDGVVQAIITEHRQRGADNDDLLSMLLAARDEETGEQMNDRQLRDEVMTLLLAGHETTANALSWAWYLLSQHHDAESRLHAELEQVLGGRTPTVEDLHSLTYTYMVLDETLRLYPPVVGFNRKALADDEVGGYFVPAGTLIWLSPYTTHRHPAFWEHPDEFTLSASPQNVLLGARTLLISLSAAVRACASAISLP